MTDRAKNSTIVARPPRKAGAELVKVTVLMPRTTHRKVQAAAKAESRPMSPMIRVLVERGLDAANG